MKESVVYISEDGCKFDNKEECFKYEAAFNKLKELFKKLPKHPENCDFTNGHGYIQHDADTFEKVKNTFYKMACAYHSDMKYEMDNYAFWCILSDSSSPFYGYGQRFLNTDIKYREYGQPYFKLHPEKVIGGQINT
jgi:hypothetical protein